MFGKIINVILEKSPNLNDLGLDEALCKSGNVAPFIKLKST